MSTPNEKKTSGTSDQKPAKAAVPAPKKFTGGGSAFFGNASAKSGQGQPRGNQGGAGLRQRRSQRGR